MRLINKILLCTGIATLLFSCSSDESAFVKVKGKSFSLKGEDYFPLMLNYIVHFRDIEGEKILSPTREYDSLGQFDSWTEEEVAERLNAHFGLISQMGFNSIRLVSLNNINYEKFYPSGGLSIYDSKGNESIFNLNENIDHIILEIEKVILMAKEHNLKVMLLLPRPRKQEQYDYIRKVYIQKILTKFKDQEAVFAYDFFNEPLYFDNSEHSHFADNQRRKENVYELVNSWKSMMRLYAPNQLFTIGFAEPLEVFEWDPTILPVDFVTFHTYNPLRVPNEIYWYSKNVNKPWMIGETSLPADNDSISYGDQALFMRQTLQRTINCGGSGFGWWQFQDVLWGPFEHNYTALINHQGKTALENGQIIYGTVKDAGKVLPNEKLEKDGDCDCWVNYFNMMGYSNYKILGRVFNEDMEPIKDAVIRGWNKSWRIGANTFTDEDGKFQLYSNTEFVNFEISAPGKNTSKFYMKLNYKPLDENLDVQNLENVNLEYHNIHYKDFLNIQADSSGSVFDFREELFDKNKLEAHMPEITLTEVKLYQY